MWHEAFFGCWDVFLFACFRVTHNPKNSLFSWILAVMFLYLSSNKGSVVLLWRLRKYFFLQLYGPEEAPQPPDPNFGYVLARPKP